MRLALLLCLATLAACADAPPEASGDARGGPTSEAGEQQAAGETVRAVLGAENARPFEAPIRFRRLGLDDGLPNAWVTSFYQDSLGFVWIGTEDGLARYDGSSLSAYRPVPFDTTSLGGTWVVGLGQALGGDMWVLSADGPLSQYHPRRDAFSRASRDTLASDGFTMLAHSDGTLWLTGASGDLLRRAPGATDSEIALAAETLGGDATALAEGARGEVYVSAYGGSLTRIGRDGTSTRLLPDSTTGARFPADYTRAVLPARDGRVYVGGDGGLIALDSAGRAEPIADLGSVTVRALLEDPAGHVWAGTDDGLARHDPATGRTARYTHDPADPWSLSRGPVEALFLDRAGTLWVGTRNGVSRFAWATPSFERVSAGPGGLSNPDVWSFLVARDGTTWVGTSGGIDGFATDGMITRIPTSADGIGQGRIVAMHQEEAGTILAASRLYDGVGVLSRFDPRTGRVLKRFTHDPELSPGHAEPHAPGELPTLNPSGLQTDREGRLWVLSGGVGCLSTFDPSSDTFESRCLDADPEGLIEADGFVQDSEGAMWLATATGGLARLEPEARTLSRILHDPSTLDSPPTSNLTTVHAGRGGALWLGTYGAGLSRFDPAAGGFRHLHAGNSALPSDVVHAIESDAEGRLWVTTNSGLARVDPETETVETFGLDDGLQSLVFNGGASLRAPDGRIYAGGPEGFNRFDPERVRSAPEPLAVVITDVAVDGAPVRPGPDAPLAVAAPYADAVRLGAASRDVSFTVAAPGGREADLRVRLEGYDDGWRPPSAGRTAVYTNLAPGRYTFRVRAGGTERALAVAVAPRFYQAWWGRALAALGVLGGALALVLARDRRRQRRERELEAEVADRTDALRAEKERTEAQADQLRELDRAKSRFFANVSHEFRTPLTLTIGPLEDLRDGMDGPLAPEAQESVDLALRSARRVLGLVNQVLDVAKLDAGRVRLQARPVALGAFVESVARAFTPLAERLGVALEVEAEAVQAWVDPEAIDTALSNLLSNAFKFTPRGGEARVRLSASGENAEITVADSGPGIAAVDLPHVFDRFYQAATPEGADSPEASGGAGAQRHPGTGIGLALAREFTELHGGRVAVESVIGQGATFTLHIPLGREHLAPEHLAPEAQAAQASGVPEPSWTDDDAHDGAAPISDPDDDQDRTTLLIVDDHAGVRAYVRRRFQADYRVLEAADGAEALALARQRLPDLVVSDVMMPVLDGVGLCRALKADPATDYLPVILLTAKVGEESTVEGLGALADAYVTKPFNVRALAARVASLIEGRRRLRARWASGDGSSLPIAAPGSVLAQPAPEAPLAPEAAFGQRVRDAVEAGLADEAFTADALAVALGLSRSALYRQMDHALGQTPAAVLREARLERGAALLRAEAGSVGEVAYAVGFRSVSAFSRAFRAHFGAPPSAVAQGAPTDG